jgi:hypothetical protein
MLHVFPDLQTKRDHHDALNIRATLAFFKRYHSRTNLKLQKSGKPFLRSIQDTTKRPSMFHKVSADPKEGEIGNVSPYLLHFIAPPLQRRLCARPNHVQRHGMQQLGRRHLRPAVIGRLGKLHNAGQQGICKNKISSV